MVRAAIGVDIGGTNLRFGLVDAKGAVLARRRIPTRGHEGVEKVLGRIKKGIAWAVEEAGRTGHKAAGIGAGVPGIISRRDGVVRLSPNLPGWRDVPLKAAIGEAFSLPAVVENDANAYALGEAWRGAARGAASLVCMTLGTGVGGGIITGGGIWRGADGMAGEVGHITVNPNGPPCHCGNRGCLERYSSATAVVEWTTRALVRGRPSSLSELFKKSPDALTAEAVKDAALSGDELANKVYRDAGKYLGIAIADLINLLNVEKIVIGGGMAGAWGLFIGPLMAEVGRRAFEIPATRCEVLPGVLGDDAGVLGAARLVFGEGTLRKGRRA